MRQRFFLRILFVIAIAAISSVVFMLLWNALLPSIFGLVRINYWQALGLLVLARIFFGNIGGKMMMNSEMRHGGRRHFRERWMNLSPEERELFIKKMQSRRHHFPFHNFDEQHSDRRSFHPPFDEQDEQNKEV